VTKPAEIHDMADDQLAEFVQRSRNEVFNLRFQHATGQLENTSRMGQAKRDLARGLTIARQRNLDVEAELRKQRENA
jgi:large subunit ribosomal protein L29